MQRYKQLTKGIHKQTSVIYIAKLSWIALKCFIFLLPLKCIKKWAQTDCLFRIL